MNAKFLELSNITIAIEHIQYFLPYVDVGDTIEVYLTGRNDPLILIGKDFELFWAWLWYVTTTKYEDLDLMRNNYVIIASDCPEPE